MRACARPGEKLMGEKLLAQRLDPLAARDEWTVQPDRRWRCSTGRATSATGCGRIRSRPRGDRDDAQAEAAPDSWLGPAGRSSPTRSTRTGRSRPCSRRRPIVRPARLRAVRARVLRVAAAFDRLPRLRMLRVRLFDERRDLIGLVGRLAGAGRARHGGRVRRSRPDGARPALRSACERHGGGQRPRCSTGGSARADRRGRSTNPPS